MTDAISSSPAFKNHNVSRESVGAVTPLKKDTDTNVQKKNDVMTLSGEALLLNTEYTRKPKKEDHSWATFGFGDGQFKLDNGNRQIVTIENSDLIIEEYDKNNKLVRKVEGSLTDDGAVLNTQIFNKNNDVIQEITTQFEGLTTGKNSSAKVSRFVQWFEDGKVKRSMEDSMLLKSTYNVQDAVISYGTQKVTDDFEALVTKQTQDSHRTNYNAAIVEYNNGKKSKEVHIKQKGEFVNQTNRAFAKTNGMDGKTTRELGQNSSLKIDTTNYGLDGKILRQAHWDESFSDSIDSTGGILKQGMDVSWYNDGELIKQEQSSAKIEETKSSKLPKRPNILEVLGVSEEVYTGGNTPKSASQIMADPLMDSSARSSFFVDNIKNHAAKGDYKTASMVEKNNVEDRPYDMQWSSTTYKDGKKIARQEDTEKARKNPLVHGLEFWTGHGLTESDVPETIKSSSHADTSYENGQEKNSAAINISEMANLNNNGPDDITTSVHGTQKKGSQSTDVHKVVDGRIEAADTDLHAASKRISKLEGQIQEDTLYTFDLLDKNNPAPKQREYHVRLKTDY
ncbi:hypothetical protein [Maridesulfovibrio sp.]|uniref:hypothetical protein n=1 Tax=Maridesulfovibrio sp. TaxID=2795000 RepID=UPI0029F54B9A|nr:hypothetical protein [Maridesulfovibrio sp.]